MKYYNLLPAIIVLFLFIDYPSYAQYTEKEIRKHKRIIAKSKKKASIEVSLDTIYHIGVPYAVIKEQEVILGVAEGYTIIALNGQEVISIDVADSEEVSDYILYRPLTKELETAYIQHFPTVKNIAKRIVKHQLLTSKGVNISNFKKFQEEYAQPESIVKQQIELKKAEHHSAKPIQVERNRSAMIFTMKNNITQDQVKIGSYKDETEQRNNKTFRVYYIYHNDKQLCGKLWIEVGNRTTMLLMTQSDKKTYTLQQTGYKQPLDVAILHLIDKLYL